MGRTDNSHLSAGEMAERLSELINQHREAEAVNETKAWLTHHMGMHDDAHFWFQYSLALRLRGLHDEALEAADQAAHCSNSTPEMERDSERDALLESIRRRQGLRHLKPYIEQLIASEGKDRNRRAVAIFTLGRLYAAQGDFDLARRAYLAAEILWSQLEPGKYDPQWRRNNRFHHMIAAAMAAPHPHSRVDQLASAIVDDDTEPYQERRDMAAQMLRLNARGPKHARLMARKLIYDDRMHQLLLQLRAGLGLRSTQNSQE